MDLSNKTVVVFGLGASGRAAATLARLKGARVIGVDDRVGLEPIDGVTLILGHCTFEEIEDADLIVVSPGVPFDHPLMVRAEEAGIAVVGELGFASRWVDLPIVAISGTNGKSTITTFVGQLLEGCGIKPFVGGNIGVPLSEWVIHPNGEHVAVVEVSSYQLERPGTFTPEVALIANLSSDHLARHGTMNSYAATKAKLFGRLCDQWAFIDSNSELLRAAVSDLGGRQGFVGAFPGVALDGDTVTVKLEHTTVFSLKDFPIPGQHNKLNAAMALLLCVALGAPEKGLTQTLPHLKGLPHRCEVVLENELVWINDSKATNLDSARVAIEGVPWTSVVLLGGEPKVLLDGSLGFETLGEALQRHRAVVCFGAGGPQIAEELAAAGCEPHLALTLKDAVERAKVLAEAGDGILLTPGCASFDEFNNYAHRGECFSELARQES